MLIFLSTKALLGVLGFEDGKSPFFFFFLVQKHHGVYWGLRMDWMVKSHFFSLLEDIEIFNFFFIIYLFLCYASYDSLCLYEV